MMGVLWRLEAAAVEAWRLAPRAVVVEAEAAARELEALLDQLGEHSRAGHAAAEARVVVTAAAHLAHDADDVAGTLGVMRGEPFLEQLFQLVGQPHDDVGRLGGAGRGGGLEHLFERLVVQSWYQRSEHYTARYTCLGEIFENVD